MTVLSCSCLTRISFNGKKWACLVSSILNFLHQSIPYLGFKKFSQCPTFCITHVSSMSPFHSLGVVLAVLNIHFESSPYVDVHCPSSKLMFLVSSTD